MLVAADNSVDVGIGDVDVVVTTSISLPGEAVAEDELWSVAPAAVVVVITSSITLGSVVNRLVTRLDGLLTDVLVVL